MRFIVKASYEPPSPAETFGARIRQLRGGKGFTQRDLAEEVTKRLRGAEKRRFGVSYLSKIESEKFGPPSDSVIIELAAVLEVDSDELLALAKRDRLWDWVRNRPRRVAPKPFFVSRSIGSARESGRIC
jgi:transcriptional regulator with XRE-family HTH domain